MGDLEVINLRASIVAALTILDFDDGWGVTFNHFFATPGMSPLFHRKREAEAFVARDSERPHGLRDLLRSGLRFGRFERGLRAASSL